MKLVMEFIQSILGKLFQKQSVTNVEQTKKPELDDLKKTKKYEQENKTSRRDFFEDIKFKNNSSRIELEFDRGLSVNNEDLRELLFELNDFTNRRFKKPILLTMIFRTQEEQDYLYRNSSKYKKKKFISPHQLWHAADIRSHSFTNSEIKEIEGWVNKRYNKTNYYKWTAKYHTVGAGYHFHIQYVRK